jgi:hypothetical protein
LKNGLTLVRGGTGATNAEDARINLGAAPLVHASRHSDGGADPVTVTNLAGFVAVTASKFLRDDGTFQSVTAGSGCNLAVGTYTGNATAHRTVTGVGFQPSVVVLWNASETDKPRIRTSANAVTKCFDGGNETGIESFDADGFTVSDSNDVNESGDTFVYICLG